MRFSCIREKIEKAVGIAERFTGKNINLPVLENILLETVSNGLKITATNLEYAAQIYISGKTEGEGKLTIPAKILGSLLQSVKEEKIVLEGKQGNLWIKTETRETKINGMPSDDFPIVPKIKKTSSFLMDGVALQNGLERVLPSVSTSDFKPELTGVCFFARGPNLKLVATDTFRLAEKTLQLSKKIEEEVKFILPLRVSQELARVISLDEQEVLVSFGDNQVLVESGAVKIISRVVDGNFPDYTGIIPQKFEISGFLARDELANAVRSASIFSSKIQDVSLVLTPKSIEVLSANPEIGEQKIRLPISASGQELKISFNFRYLLDGLNVLDSEEMFLGCNSETSPSLLRPKTDDSFLYVLMPIRAV